MFVLYAVVALILWFAGVVFLAHKVWDTYNLAASMAYFVATYVYGLAFAIGAICLGQYLFG